MYSDKGHRGTDLNRMGCFSKRISPSSLWLLLWVAIALIMSGCTMVGPDFVKPEAPLLNDWAETKSPELIAGQTDYKNWWHVFGDPVLDNLVQKAYEQNLSLQIAGIRIYEARAQLGIAIGSQYPQQQKASGDLANNKISIDDKGPIDNTFNSLSLGFDAAWEIDIWGKYSRSVQSGVANVQTSVASYDNILVSLTAEVARTYILIRTLEQKLIVAWDNVKLQKESLWLAEIQFKEGAVSELDVAQAKILLNNTQASIPRVESSLRKARNALAILLGMLPGQLTELLNGPGKIPTATETVIVDIPNNLLRRRPDIRLAEVKIAAQSPQIGIAKADLYPHFSLFGSIGWQSSDTAFGENSLSDLFSYKSLYWSAGPGFSWDILNYGRIKNRVRVEDARLQQLVVNYKDTVLNAYREVDDAMVAYTRSKEEEYFLQNSVTAAERSVKLSLVQYKEGVVDYQRVLDSQRYLVTQSDLLTEVSGQVSTNLVATYKALGGGWETREGKEILSEKNRNEMIQRTNWGKILNLEALKLPVDTNELKGLQQPDW